MWFPWCFSQNVLHNNCGHPSLRIMTFHHILPQTTPLPQESTISTMPTLGAYPVSPPVTPPPLSSPYPEFLVLPRVTHPASSSTSSSNTSSWETMSEEGTLDDNRLEDKEPPFSPLEPLSPPLPLPLCCCWCLELRHSHTLCPDYTCPICLFQSPGHESNSYTNSLVEPDSSDKEQPFTSF